MFDYSLQLEELFDAGKIQLSTIKPSEWAEKNRVMDSSESPFPGPFRYSKNPYTREIVDCLSPDHPARIVAVMKGAQVGFSTSVIEPGVGWIISQNPGNILFLTGHSDLSEEAVLKIDKMIDSCGIRSLIRPTIMRAKSNKTGDTNTKKEFPGGSLVSGSAGNHKLLRQRSVRYGFIDDYEAVKSTSKESGATRNMIEQRFAAYYDKMKLYYISTPELKQNSNIEPVYLAGDQRRYKIPCPICSTYIHLEWSTAIAGTDGKEIGGITWKTDSRGRLIDDSVGYICQMCGEFFTDKNKFELNMAGFWEPTAEPQEKNLYSYHLSSLYAPPGMYDWKFYVQQYISACPEDGKRDESKYKAFVNLALGLTYEEQGEAPKANQLQKNIRSYEIGIIPDRVSIRDGNGTIMLLTCACDLNGLEDDARLDYEIVAHSENGATYSIKHGSIGTFIPRENAKKNKEDRERWTYHWGKANSVWPVFDKILSEIYLTDNNRKMKIGIAGVDTGHYTKHAYDFIDRTNNIVFGLKGKDTEKLIKFSADLTTFRKAKERNKLYLVEVNVIKDDLADLIKLKWNEDYDDEQPSGFMNFPIPSGGMYLFNNYFSHYEAEERRVETKDGEGMAARWVKKASNVQNHFFDVRIYNMVLRDIIVHLVCTELKMKNFGWSDYVDVILGGKRSA